MRGVYAPASGYIGFERTQAQFALQTLKVVDEQGITHGYKMVHILANLR